MMDFSQLEGKLNYTFKDKNILKRALTLASADGANNNQTLEFFGDAILEFIVSERIFGEEQSEGQLTERRKAIVSDRALEPVSKQLGLDKFLIRSQYDISNKKSVPSAYEAVVAAIYLDGGIDAARQFVLNTLNFDVYAADNFKGELQEFLQGAGKPCPVYSTKETGTPQNPEQTAEVMVDGKTFTGVAVRARDAEQQAAKQALEYLKSE